MAITLAKTFSIVEMLERFLLEIDSTEMLSSKAEYLHLPLDAADTEVEVDEGIALVGTGDGGRKMVFSLPLLLTPLLLPSSKAILIAGSCSCPFPFPFTCQVPFPLLNKAGLLEVAPRDCCEAWKACFPFTTLGMMMPIRS